MAAADDIMEIDDSLYRLLFAACLNICYFYHFFCVNL